MKPREGDPFDSFPKNFWQEFSSPFTDTPEENEIEDGEETTTHEPFPYFDEPSSSVNVTTHLGNSVYLHCRVNDLNGKTVSIQISHSLIDTEISVCCAFVCSFVAVSTVNEIIQFMFTLFWHQKFIKALCWLRVSILTD